MLAVVITEQRGRRRLLRWLLVALVLVGLLLVGLDRGGAWAAERVVADRVAEELASRGIESAPPEAKIDRAPFLPQVAAGRYESVTVRLREVDTAAVQLSLVELTATGVTASTGALLAGEGAIVAERVTGEALLEYAALPGLAGMSELSLSTDAEGRLWATRSLEGFGASLTLTGAAEVTVVDDAVQLRVTELSVTTPAESSSDVAGVLAQHLRPLSVTLPLPPLPYGLSLDSVDVTPDGLVLRVSARDVPLAG